MDNDNIVMLLDEDGNKVAREIIASLKVNNKSYAILHDAENDEDMIFEVIEQAGEDLFKAVEDPDELQDIIDAYYEL